MPTGIDKPKPQEKTVLSRQRTRKRAAMEDRKPLDINSSDTAQHHRENYDLSPTHCSKSHVVSLNFYLCEGVRRHSNHCLHSIRRQDREIRLSYPMAGNEAFPYLLKYQWNLDFHLQRRWNKGGTKSVNIKRQDFHHHTADHEATSAVVLVETMCDRNHLQPAVTRNPLPWVSMEAKQGTRASTSIGSNKAKLSSLAYQCQRDPVKTEV